MVYTYTKRRVIAVIILLLVLIFVIINNTPVSKNQHNSNSDKTRNIKTSQIVNELNKLPVKGRAPKTGYTREQFGSGWLTKNGCDTRNIILHRDLSDDIVDKNCHVVSGILDDPYTGKIINFSRGSKTSGNVQIDHVVPLSDAWQKGAQQLSFDQRITFANDPLELLAVDQKANQQKSDGDAATWLPANKSFRCQYIARQIAVKIKYQLWVTKAESNAMHSIIKGCPDQMLPSP